MGPCGIEKSNNKKIHKSLARCDAFIIDRKVKVFKRRNCKRTGHDLITICGLQFCSQHIEKMRKSVLNSTK